MQPTIASWWPNKVLRWGDNTSNILKFLIVLDIWNVRHFYFGNISEWKDCNKMIT
jgi:hypothetical protein